MKSIMVLFHCQANTGYAIGPLEETFFKMAMELCDRDLTRIHFAYPSMKNGPSPTLPRNFSQYTIVDVLSNDSDHWNSAEKYIRAHEIDTVFGFDQPVHLPIYRYFRRGGVKHFVSYWGAPMSSWNPLPIRILKRLGVIFRRGGPNRYIFESNGMASLATNGRGVPSSWTTVVPLGIDTERFRPNHEDAGYIYEKLQIPRRRRIIFYSGHMEARKGIAVIMETANLLHMNRAADDWHFVLCGNKLDESVPYEAMLSDQSRAHVTFAGYRTDTAVLQRGCYCGVIASTGWDSFPRSALEMQGSGLPLIVSDLAGIKETVDAGKTGYVVKAGDAPALAREISNLLDNPAQRDLVSRAARTRIEENYTLAIQLKNLTNAVRAAISGK